MTVLMRSTRICVDLTPNKTVRLRNKIDQNNVWGTAVSQRRVGRLSI